MGPAIIAVTGVLKMGSTSAELWIRSALLALLARAVVFSGTPVRPAGGLRHVLVPAEDSAAIRIDAVSSVLVRAFIGDGPK